MSDRLFSLSTRDPQSMATLRPGTTTKAFADVCADRLRRLSKLRRVNELARRFVDEAIDVVRELIGRVEPGEVTMIAHA